MIFNEKKDYIENAEFSIKVWKEKRERKYTTRIFL